MSNYSQTTLFGPKDSLPTNNPGKTIFGAAYDVEFGNIATAIATKPDNLTTASFLNVNVTSATVPANGIYLSAANALSLSSNSTQRILVAAAGNITIFAPTAGDALTINGFAGANIISAVTASTSIRGPQNANIASSGGDYPYIGHNALATTVAGTYKYDTTDLAAAIQYNAGTFQFRTAPSGTAGNNITWTTKLAIANNGAITVTPSSGVLPLQITNGGAASPVMNVGSNYISTGATTPVLTANKPAGGGTAIQQWLQVQVNGTTGWIPVWQ